jgi:hypothetical protein
MTALLEGFEAGVQTMVGIPDAGRLRHQVVDLSVDEDDVGIESIQGFIQADRFVGVERIRRVNRQQP